MLASFHKYKNPKNEIRNPVLSDFEGGLYSW